MTWRKPTLLTFLLFLLFPLAASLNITRILGKFPDFYTLNHLLTRTKLATKINSRNTLTVLAVTNDVISPVAGSSVDDLSKILAVHVMLDYLDVDKIHLLADGAAKVTTLFQASGLATGNNGFLNVTDMANGQIAFASAEEGSPLGAYLIKEVKKRPYNISVLQISNVIIPPGLSISPPADTQPPTPPAGPMPDGPAPSGDAGSPGEAPNSSGDAGKSPSTAPAGGDAPSDAPEASSPDADDSSAGAPSDTSDGPTADGDGASNDESSAARWGAVGAGAAAAVAFAMLALQ